MNSLKDGKQDFTAEDAENAEKTIEFNVRDKVPGFAIITSLPGATCISSALSAFSAVNNGIMARSKAEWALRFKHDAAQYVAGLQREVQLAAAFASATTPVALSQSELDNLRELYRLAHTIKGSAAMVDQPEVARLGQQLEQLFGESYRAETRLSASQCDTAQVLIAQIQTGLELIR